MPKRTPLISVTVTRPNDEDPKKPKRITPEIGKPFDFTDDEIKQIEASSPGSLSTKATVNLTDDGKPAGDVDDENDTNDATKANFAKTAGAKTAKGGRGSSTEL